MSPESILAIIGGVVAVSGAGFLLFRKLPKRIKATHYRRKWRELQKMCGDKQTWPDAIVGADKLLDEVLKKKRKPGKKMGERMVAAQKSFTNNDAIWKAHKLANHIAHSEEDVKLKEDDVKDSLVAFRQALRDLRAL